MVLNYYLEAAILPLELLLCVYLQIKYRGISEVNRRFKRFAFCVTLATFLDVIYAIAYNTHAVHRPQMYLLLDAVAHMAAFCTCLLFQGYIISFLKDEELQHRLGRLRQAASVVYLLLWIWNFFSGIIVSYDEYGYYSEGLLYTPMVFGVPLLVLLTGAVMAVVYRRVYDRWQRIALISCFFVAFILYVSQMFFNRGLLVIFFIGGMSLYILFFCLETPIYMQLNRQMQDLEKAHVTAQKASREAEEANLEKSEFLANMSHEIRTPMNTILGMDELILREATDAEVQRYAREIAASGNRLMGIVEDVLDFSRIETGKLILQPTRYHLGNVLKEMESIIAPKAAAKGLDFQTKVAPNVPDELYGDALRVSQVIRNLLNNAVQYTSSGSVTLSVAAKRHYDKVHLHIDVTDTGSGIRAEDVAHLFDSYRRREGMEASQGTGLGLAITKLLAERMGGSIDVQTKPGEGSTFHVMLQQDVIGDKTVAEYQQTQQYGRSAQAHRLTAPKARILAVDDNKMNTTVLKGLLRTTLAQVDCVYSGAECLKALHDTAYDLVFLDHMMPGMDGIETLHAFREDTTAASKGVTVIALTANAVSGAKEQYLGAGFNDYLSKPVRPEALEAMLLKHLPPELMGEET